MLLPCSPSVALMDSKVHAQHLPFHSYRESLAVWAVGWIARNARNAVHTSLHGILIIPWPVTKVGSVFLVSAGNKQLQADPLMLPTWSLPAALSSYTAMRARNLALIVLS